jgi:hypothetical protein
LKSAIGSQIYTSDNLERAVADLTAEYLGLLSKSPTTKMVSRLRIEDRLDAISNYSSWKERIKLVLLVNDLWEFVDTHTTKPTDPAELAKYNKSDAKARLIILDGVKDRLIPDLTGKDTSWHTWEALKALFQYKNENRKMVLREKLREIGMTGSKNVTSYLTKIQQVRYELAAIGDNVADIELVRTTLKGSSKQWKPFIKGVVSREKLPDWNKLWDDFIQEELRDDDLQHKSCEHNALASQLKKSKGMKDLSKVRFYACNKFGHYANQCLIKKKKGGNEKQVEMAAPAMFGKEELAKRFQDEFLPVSHLLESTIHEGAWFLDSGATKHMTGTR